MSSTGFILAGAGASNHGAWANPGAVIASDDSRATIGPLTAGLPATTALQATNFGFAVPAGSVITGVTVRVERSTGASPSDLIVDGSVQLIGVAGVSNDKADAVTNWPQNDATVDYGGSGDTWGLALTTDDVNSAGFGVAIKAQPDAAGTAASARIDAVWINIEYRARDTGPPMMMGFGP